MVEPQRLLLPPHVYSLVEAQKLINKYGVNVNRVGHLTFENTKGTPLEGFYKDVLSCADIIVNPLTEQKSREQNDLIDLLFTLNK